MVIAHHRLGTHQEPTLRLPLSSLDPTDYRYIHTFSGFAYLATVIDLFSNKVIGWMVADHMRTDLVLDALDMALAARRPGIGEAVMHTNRGTQAVHLACFP